MTAFQQHYDSSIAFAQDALNVSNRGLFTAALFTIHVTAFYAHAWIFVLADWYGFLDRWAIRSGRHRAPSISKQWDSIRDGTVDAFIVKPLVFYIVFPLAEKFVSFGDLPSLQTGVVHWTAMAVIFSTSLFWIHAAMHYFPSVYKLVHKKHHTFHETVSFAAQFAHPLEGLASSCHIILTIVIVKPHFVILCIFLFTTFVEIVDSHCGYDVPWAALYLWSDRYPWGSGARAHDYHHSHNIGMYGGGLIGVWDALMGTDKDFKNHEANRKKGLKDT